jgi:hypothetical protein
MFQVQWPERWRLLMPLRRSAYFETQHSCIPSWLWLRGTLCTLDHELVQSHVWTFMSIVEPTSPFGWKIFAHTYILSYIHTYISSFHQTLERVSDLAKQPSELDVQPWIQPGPGETIDKPKIFRWNISGCGGGAPPILKYFSFNPPHPRLEGGMFASCRANTKMCQKPVLPVQWNSKPLSAGKQV